ncbi:MAG: hypothetical protein ACREH3_17620, partial [Geminicoccales bacterium]
LSVFARIYARGGTMRGSPRLAAVGVITTNKKNEYLEGFRFQVAKGDQGDRDKPFGPVGATGREK